MKRLCFVLAFAMSPQCFAYPYPQALENLIDDFAVCATFYNFLYAQAVSSKWEKEKGQMLAARDNAATWVHELMKDKPPGWETSKLEVNQKIMMAEYEKSGLEGLYLAHSDICKVVLNDYQARLQYWLDKGSRP